MKKKVLIALIVVLAFALTACGGKKEAYETFISYVDNGQIVEAYEFWETEGEEIFGESDYKDIKNYRNYVKAVGPYVAGEPVRLSTSISYLAEIPYDFMETEKYIEEMDDLLDGIKYEFTDPTETYYDNVAKLKLDGEDFRFVMGTLGDSGCINWVVKDGKILYGTGSGDRFDYTFTFTETGIEVTSDTEGALYAGTYLK